MDDNYKNLDRKAIQSGYDDVLREAAMLELKTHKSVMVKVKQAVLEQIGGFVIFVGTMAQSYHTDKEEAQALARAFKDFHRDVRIRSVRIGRD